MQKGGKTVVSVDPCIGNEGSRPSKLGNAGHFWSFTIGQKMWAVLNIKFSDVWWRQLQPCTFLYKNACFLNKRGSSLSASSLDTQNLASVLFFELVKLREPKKSDESIAPEHYTRTKREVTFSQNQTCLHCISLAECGEKTQ